MARGRRTISSTQQLSVDEAENQLNKLKEKTVDKSKLDSINLKMSIIYEQWEVLLCVWRINLQKSWLPLGGVSQGEASATVIKKRMPG
ncbi:ASN_collapsed_G0051500.mRNA.1.CDS.1 [Saccharomyces cerevisiae]|nr:ASN_collapsed_G0051500.mRNA.1.CDS.1 [Saccharomyces cerevisiae]